MQATLDRATADHLGLPRTSGRRSPWGITATAAAMHDKDGRCRPVERQVGASQRRACAEPLVRCATRHSLTEARSSTDSALCGDSGESGCRDRSPGVTATPGFGSCGYGRLVQRIAFWIMESMAADERSRGRRFARPIRAPSEPIRLSFRW